VTDTRNPVPPVVGPSSCGLAVGGDTRNPVPPVVGRLVGGDTRNPVPPVVAVVAVVAAGEERR